jgi:hypothetical protein
MVEAMKHQFDKIDSIELSREIYERAEKRLFGDGTGITPPRTAG